VSCVEALQQQRFDQRADQGNAKRGHDDAEPERRCTATEHIGEEIPRRIGAIGAQHVKRAVREIDNPRHAEDQRQARGDEEQRRRRRKAVQQLQGE
jgi:hypothetical protein